MSCSGLTGRAGHGLRCWVLLGVLSLLGFTGCAKQAPQPQVAVGPAPNGEAGDAVCAPNAPYLGQRLPGRQAELFAPGLIDNGVNTRDVAMTPEGDEIYFCQEVGGYTWATILVTRRTADGWTVPEVASFSGNPDWTDLEPAISPDGRRFYFLSTRPSEPGGEPGQQDIWVMDRTADGWSEPWNPGPPINTTDAEFFPSPTRDGSLYFTRRPANSRIHQIWRVRPTADGGWSEAELLPDEVNGGGNRFNALVQPDEDWIIVPLFGTDDSLGGVDYYVSFRGDDDTWTEPVNLGPQVNSAGMQEWSPALSPDGRFLFVMSNRQATTPDGPLTWAELERAHSEPGQGGVNIWWLSAEVIDEARDGGSASAPETADPAPALPSLTAPKPLLPLDTGAMSLHDRLERLPGDPPGDEPQLFAPGLVCTGQHDRDVIFTADNREIYFGLMTGAQGTVRVIRFSDGRWSEPELAGFATDRNHNAFEPTFSADGLTVLFLSTLPAEGETVRPGWLNQNIAVARRPSVDAPWGTPELVPAPISTAAAEYCPSLTDDGVLYFTRESDDGTVGIWRADPVGDGWAEPEKLPEAVNCAPRCYNGTVARDASWLLYCVSGHEENLGPADYWIAFRGPDGDWQPAVNLGEKVNAADQRAGSATLTPDGRYLLFSARRAETDRYFPDGRLTRDGLAAAHAGPENGSLDVYWLKADFLEALRP